MDKLRKFSSPGAHLNVSALNSLAPGFYTRLGFRELARTGTAANGSIYLGKILTVS